MFYITPLNQDSKQRIQNIANGFRNYPAYSAYQIKSYVYDLHSGAHALEITRDGKPVNLFLFYPDEGGSGKIGSIAVYGSSLQGHYNAMKSSMMAFGMPISSISIESGTETFIDIYLDY
jgi:hypothetical protein